jgi:hypothetical protein
MYESVDMNCPLGFDTTEIPVQGSYAPIVYLWPYILASPENQPVATVSFGEIQR